MARWSPTVLPQAAPVANYDSIGRAIENAGSSFFAARGQRDALRHRKERDAIDDARYDAQQGRQAQIDKGNAESDALKRLETVLGLQTKAGELGYVPEANTAAAQTSNFRGVNSGGGMAGSAASAVANALDGATQNQPRMTLPAVGGGQSSMVLDPTRTPDAREQNQATRQLERALEMQRRGGAITLEQAPALAAASRGAVLGVDRANKVGEFAPKEPRAPRQPTLIQGNDGNMYEYRNGQMVPVPIAGAGGAPDQPATTPVPAIGPRAPASPLAALAAPIAPFGKSPTEKPMSEGAAKRIEALRTIRLALGDYKTLFESEGPALISGSSEGRARLDSQYGNVQMALKEAFNLGVLNGPDLALIEKQLTKPTSATATLVKGAPAMLAQIDQLAASMEQREATISDVYGLAKLGRGGAPTAKQQAAATSDEKIRADAKAEGYTDAQIDAFLKNRKQP